ncbi:MAG: Gfo/Idh/MocA family oxidoreductase [Gemmataceae bacterium]|nr:Gfo/Idh/MocA family oxidoreductase [Gemmataceae bacterium]
MAKKIRVAVIGRTGKGGYGHGLDVVWKGFDEVEIVAVADENEAGLKTAVSRLGAKTGYADYRQMLEKEKPQIVSVGDRFLDLHKDMVVACAENGASVFLEKPMARNLAEADEMIAVCERHHVKLAIAHQTRYSPRMAQVKKMIAEGQLGDLIEMHGRGKEDTRGGGQDLMVLGTHIFDLMRYFAGHPKLCFSKILVNGQPATRADIKEGGEGMGPILGDHLWAAYNFDNGLLGTFGTHKAKAGAGQRFALHLYGTKGAIHVATGGLASAWYCDNPSWSPTRGKINWQEITSQGVGKPETLKEGGLGQGNGWIVKDLLEAIAKDRQPLGSGYDGRGALEMIMGVYESFRVGAPVEMPLKNRKHPLLMM